MTERDIAERSDLGPNPRFVRRDVYVADESLEEQIEREDKRKLAVLRGRLNMMCGSDPLVDRWNEGNTPSSNMGD